MKRALLLLAELRLVAGCSHPYHYRKDTLGRIVQSAKLAVREAPSAKLIDRVREDLGYRGDNAYHVNERMIDAYRDGWHRDDLTSRLDAEKILATARRYFDGKNYVTGTIKPP